MSFFKMISTGLSAVGKNQRVMAATSFAKKGGVGTLAVAGIGVGGIGGYYSYGRDYGAGAGVLLGVGEAVVFEGLSRHPVGIGLGVAAVGGYFAYQKGREIYKENRRINMGRPMMDDYGTLGQMRMQSIQSLSRDRSGVSRTLGNEARMLHR